MPPVWPLASSRWPHLWSTLICSCFFRSQTVTVLSKRSTAAIVPSCRRYYVWDAIGIMRLILIHTSKRQVFVTLSGLVFEVRGSTSDSAGSHNTHLNDMICQNQDIRRLLPLYSADYGNTCEESWWCRRSRLVAEDHVWLKLVSNQPWKRSMTWHGCPECLWEQWKESWFSGPRALLSCPHWHLKACPHWASMKPIARQVLAKYQCIFFALHPRPSSHHHLPRSGFRPRCNA